MEIYCATNPPLLNSFSLAFAQIHHGNIVFFFFRYIYFIYFFSPRNLFFASSNTESSLHTANRK